MHRRSGYDHGELFAVGNAAVIFAPVHFSGIRAKVRASYMVMGADFGAAQTAKEAFRQVRAAIGVRLGFRVIDALRVIRGMEGVPVRGFVRIDRAAGGDTVMQHRDGGGF